MTPKENQLREIIATMLEIEPDKIEPTTTLRQIGDSLGRARLDVRLKRAGLQVPRNIFPATFGELCAAFSGTPSLCASSHLSDDHRSGQSHTDAASEGVQVGLDVQEIQDFPLASDYWEDDFYRGMFDKSEIAYAIAQAEPRVHFAGFWCAKEALRKCDSDFAGVDPISTVVAHDQPGRPYFLDKRSNCQIRLPHSLSISHTSRTAVAVAIRTVFMARA
jgi:phosphopantetheinyl transferase (holo-ACP synthase)